MFSKQMDLEKQVGVAILISDKIDFKLKSIRRDGDEHFILITGTIHKDEVSILNTYAPNIKTPTYVKETLLELRTYIKPHTLIVGISTLLSHQWTGQPDRKLTEK